MSRRTQNRNQYESGTTGELTAGAFTVTVESAAGLITDQPMYLVIEPDIPGQREWLRIESITGNQLNIANPNGRNLTGSDGDLTHPPGSKVRSVPSQQIFEDIFTDAEDDELALTQHQTDGGDPHAQAGYLTVSETDPLYVNVSGDTMNSLAQIKVDTNPAVADDLARKGYVDDEIDADILFHKQDPDAHHVEFVEVDADALYLPLDGAVAMAAAIQMGGFKVTGLAEGTATGDAARFDELDAALVRITELESAVDALETSPVSHTHTAAETISGAFADARIPNLNASKTNAGTFADARIPFLNASKTNAGEFDAARIPDINASTIIAGAFRSGAWTMVGGTLVLQNGTALGVDGNINVNGTVDFAGLAINAGGVDLRLVGTSVTRSG